MRPLRAFLKLSPAERRAALLALGLLPSYSLALRVLPWPRLHDDPPPSPAPRTGATIDPIRAARVVDAVAARLPRKPGCLARSLALRRILRAQGVDARLRIGVRKAGPALDAHAWLEAGGVTLGESQGYASLDARGRETPGSR